MMFCRDAGRGVRGTVRGAAVETTRKDGVETMNVTKRYEAAARRAPGCFPHWLSAIQPYWTLVGTVEDEREGLFCEDGTVEAHKRGFTIQPVLRVAGSLVTRNEALVVQTLERGYLPIPTVTWTYGAVTLDVQAFAYGGRSSTVYLRYSVRAQGSERWRGRLYLMLHPVQVYPPWQGGHDGFARIRAIRYAENVVDLDEGRRVFLATKPDTFMALAGGVDVADRVLSDQLQSVVDAADEEGLASAVAAYDFDLVEGECREVFVAVPLHDVEPVWAPGLAERQVRKQYESMRDELVELWESRVSRVEIRVPDRGITDALKANIAYNLITRDGVGFQPGSRSYDKSWMRDGGVQALAMLKMGAAEEAGTFIDWMGSFQLESGEVSPIIDTKREDPLWEEKAGLCEYDSQGQFVHAVWEYYRFTRDMDFLKRQFGRVEKALKFLEALRASRCTPEYRNGPPEKRMCFGIIPVSRSYEPATPGGPFHTYWDSFWALVGWNDGCTMAESLGESRLAEWMRREYAALRDALWESMALVNASRDTSGVPRFVEADAFEPAFTVGALAHGGQLHAISPDLVKITLDRYVELVKARMVDGAQFVLAPYELMMVRALLQMDKRRSALEALRFLMRYRRPMGWHQFAEVVDSNARFPRNIGDMPHAWVGAEYLHAVRGLFAEEDGDVLIVGQGISEEWVRGDGVSVQNLPTQFGVLNFDMRGDCRKGVRVHLWGDARPPRGIRFKLPVEMAGAEVSDDGRAWKAALPEGIIVDGLPAEFIFREVGKGGGV